MFFFVFFFYKFKNNYKTNKKNNFGQLRIHAFTTYKPSDNLTKQNMTEKL